MTVLAPETVTLTDLVAAVRRQQRSTATAAADHPAGREADLGAGMRARAAWLTVAGAHPGAGATSVSLAITDALAAEGHRVRLVDVATAPDAFATVEQEIDSGQAGARRGRRGHATIFRPSAPGDGDEIFTGIVVLDGSSPCVGQPRPMAVLRVVVCRATVPSLTKAERLLAADRADDPALVVAVVGTRRWPKAVRAVLGPAIARAVDEGRVVFFGRDRALEVYGPTPEPMPSHLCAAGRRLVDLALPEAVLSEAVLTELASSRERAGR